MAGALRQFVVTLDGTVQNLGVLFPADKNTSFVELTFTQQGGAAAYVGEAGSVVSSTNYALTAPASAAREAKLSAVGASKLRFQDIEVIGTDTQKLSIAAVAW